MTQWEHLGPETKKLFFKDPALIRDLDNFFTLAQRSAENPNPSGTAYVGLQAGQALYVFHDPIGGGAMQIGAAGLAALLRNPTAVRILTKGLTIRAGHTAAAAIAARELFNLAAPLAQPASTATPTPPAR